MTDDTATPDPLPSLGGRWRIAPLGAVLALVVGSVVACGSDSGDEPTATDTVTSSATTAPSVSGSPSESPTSSATATPDGDPVPSPIINKAVKDAIRDDFPALVPSGVPAGWTVVSATYDGAKGGTWRIDLTDPSGAEVVLVQADVSVERLVADYLGKDGAAEGKVDLSDYGTGVWTAYGGMNTHGIAKKISHTGALVYATTQATAVTLAQELLTAEDSGHTDGG